MPRLCGLIRGGLVLEAIALEPTSRPRPLISVGMQDPATLHSSCSSIRLLKWPSAFHHTGSMSPVFLCWEVQCYGFEISTSTPPMNRRIGAHHLCLLRAF